MRLLIILIIVLVSSCTKGQDKYKTDRNNMVRQQIERRGIRDEKTLNAMRRVERHKFVPSYLVSSAYNDRPLAIGHGQTISQPYIVAYMTEILELEKADKALEIGTGSGYQAAVLAEIADSVFTIEIIEALYESATQKLSELEYKNVYTKNADGYFGWEEHAPYDAIIVTAASEIIPPPLIDQLKDGGKMIIPVGSPFMNQMLVLVEKKNGKTTTQSLLPVRFVPFTRK